MESDLKTLTEYHIPHTSTGFVRPTWKYTTVILKLTTFLQMWEKPF